MTHTRATQRNVRTDALREAPLNIPDEFDAADFRGVERILEILKRQERTTGGFPRVRPDDCSRVTAVLRAVFEANRSHFRTGDRKITERFDELLESFVQTDVRHYPKELFKVRLLQAETKLLLNDPEGIQTIVKTFADRPYAIETDFHGMANLMWLDGQARMLLGDTAGIGPLFWRRILMLARFNPLRSWQMTDRFAPFLGIGVVRHNGDGVLAYIARKCAELILSLRRGGGIWRVPLSIPFEYMALVIAGFCVAAAVTCGPPWRRRWAQPTSTGAAVSKEVVVTRAMGGIGDLLMMTPGLRALAMQQRKPVKFAVSRGFFPLFEHNPHVELVDIDGPALDLGSFARWFNLTICPAAAHESRVRPFVRKSRIELFARGMGIGRRLLNRYGWDIQIDCSENDLTFKESFLKQHGFGERPLIGVQPYSRDAYKDHPGIISLIRRVAGDYDIIVFHHTNEGIPSGPGLASTAGLSIGRSFALVSALDVMVAVDSAFLHAASAFDIPVIALFGPTDGKVFTQHYKRVTLLAPSERFPCAPCWRNEDLPCQVTGQTGISPCIAAIPSGAIVQAIANCLQSGTTA